MNPADRKQFLAILNGLAAMKPGAKITDESLDLWWSCMADWSIEEFRAAANHLSRESEFMPNPYHFEQLRKSGRSTHTEAWLRAKSATDSCRQPGGYGPGGTCGDALIDSAVRAIGGYSALAMCESSKLGFLEKRFSEHYAALQDAAQVRHALPHYGGERLKDSKAADLVGSLVKVKRLQ